MPHVPTKWGWLYDSYLSILAQVKAFSFVKLYIFELLLIALSKFSLVVILLIIV